MGSIKIPEAAQKAIQVAREARANRSLEDVAKDIRQERKARHIRWMRQILDGKK